MIMAENMEIDLVYLWVDGGDPEWRKRRNLYSQDSCRDEGMDSEARYADNGELRYSLRSADLYAPWIRKIFIVTDNQVPEWLDVAHPKIKIVDHKEILPADALPTFNSTVIEHALFRIPGLSEHFLYANDDMFFNKAVEKSDFFAKDGMPIIRMTRRPFRKLWYWYLKNIKKYTLNNYNRTIHNSSLLVEKEYGRYIGHKTHHNIDAYLKSDYEETYKKFKESIYPTLYHHIRNDNDIQRNIYSYVPIMEKRGHLKFVTQKTSFRCHIEHPHYIEDLKKSNPMLFCINDSQYANEASHKLVADFLKERFPEKSQFEK